MYEVFFDEVRSIAHGFPISTLNTNESGKYG
jgi:hypothetical protein